MSPEGLILEGIVTTVGAGGRVNISPMGPRVTRDLLRLTLRPFKTAQTYGNLKAHGEGVFHVTDDVELLARSAVNEAEAELRPAHAVKGFILAGACRAYEFRVASIEDAEERATIEAEVVRCERIRDYFGLNRGKHAVVEAAILATRLHLLPLEEVIAKYSELEKLVLKTGGEAEQRAFAFLSRHVEAARGRTPPRRVHVTAGSRLHFGLISPDPGAARRFGGAGVMVARPSIEVTVERSEGMEVDGPLSGRAIELARRICGQSMPPFRIRIQTAPRDHTGLGTGTQLGLAVSSAIAALDGKKLPVSRLAALAGRGARSAVGVHGFERGGFLVDGGKRQGDDALAPLLVRLPVPESWRFVLALPRDGAGISGRAEEESFRRLAESSGASARALCQALLLGMAPALADGDLRAFGEALHEYGVRSGECFKKAQGGVFASPGIAALVDFVRSEGVAGAGQSSWGPTVYAVVDGEDQARRLAERIVRRFDGERVEAIVTAPLNRGAEVRLETGGPEETAQP